MVCDSVASDEIEAVDAGLLGAEGHSSGAEPPGQRVSHSAQHDQGTCSNGGVALCMWPECGPVCGRVCMVVVIKGQPKH